MKSIFTTAKTVLKTSLLTLTALSMTIASIHLANAHEHGKHGPTETLMVDNPTVKTTPPGIENSAAYFHIKNNSDKDITLVDAKSDVAKIVEIHEHAMVDGAMKMQKVKFINIPAKSSVHFKSSGYHVMFIGLNKTIKADDKVDVTLIFDDGTSKKISATAVESKKHNHKHLKHH